jgi:hypothetical protein
LAKKRALTLAKQEAWDYFNRCKQCGKWIGDTVCKIDEVKCMGCAPLTMEPYFCT